MTKITLTGGYGFLGSNVFNALTERGYKVSRFHSVPAVSARPWYNLIYESDVEQMYHETKPGILVHVAGVVGGIGANQQNPGKYFYQNLKMGMNLIEEGRRRQLGKYVQVSTVCAYPRDCPTPFKESDLWNGYPEETNAPYGIAKKALLVMLKAYEQQYRFKSNYLIPVNLYGPGDNFNPESSHVIPALIKKFYDAMLLNKSEVEIWGTGQATREFLFVRDAAGYIADAVEHLNDSDPINIGTGVEISIKELVGIISSEMGFSGKIVWDTSKPDGQPRRQLDITRMKEKLPNTYRTEFRDGLKETIEWYKENNANS